MAKYVMSDLHGCYEEFKEMLFDIDFKDEDKLYILGDVFDRGPKPLEIIDYIAGKKNIYLLKGNHELMFENCATTGDPGEIRMWIYNGGGPTFNAILKKGKDFEQALLKYIIDLPIIMVVDDNILVHAGLYLPDDYEKLTIKEIVAIQDEDYILWDRSSIGCERKIEGYNIICGHTPVQSIVKDREPKILHANGTYYIDCGCVFDKAGGKLACLRLDDKQEFYVERGN